MNSENSIDRFGFLMDSCMGSGLATYTGSMPESSRFYVRCEELDHTNAIADELFGEASLIQKPLPDYPFPIPY